MFNFYKERLMESDYSAEKSTGHEAFLSRFGSSSKCEEKDDLETAVIVRSGGEDRSTEGAQAPSSHPCRRQLSLGCSSFTSLGWHVFSRCFQSGAGLEDTARHGSRAAVAVSAAEP